MKSDLASALATAGIIGASLAAGFFAGVVVWGLMVNVAAHNGGDPIDPAMAIFDSRAFVAGLMVTLITTLIVAFLLSWGWRALSRRGPSS